MSAEVKTGYTFEEVRIGTQVWMKKNYDFGGPTGTFPNNSEANISDYGRLYTWEEAMAIDYPGWHLPTAAEFTTLITYLGGDTVAGGHLKETGTTYWDTPNTDADNTSGFSARGSGYNEVLNFKQLALFWGTEFSEDNGTFMLLSYTDASASVGDSGKTNRFAVRLIKD